MRVAVAIITDEQGRVLVTQRPLHVAQGGFWEFPGGKLEPHESAEQALCREIKEELDIDVQEFRYLGDIQHQYPKQLVHLLVFHVVQFQGQPSCREGQLGMKWIAKEQLNEHEFPEANCAIFRLLELL